jgi:hypothetical protein
VQEQVPELMLEQGTALVLPLAQVQSLVLHQRAWGWI